MPQIEVETYHSRSRVPDSDEDAPPIDDAAWAALVEQLEVIEDPLIELTNGWTGVEEDLPRIRNETFYPGGWVGQYEGGIRVVPERAKLSDEQYQSLLTTVTGWIESAGMATAESVLHFSPDTITTAESIYTTYSQGLIEYTEQLLTGRLPVAVERPRHRGLGLTGPPDFAGTIQEHARGSPLFVSRETNFTQNTPFNRLLVQFHRDLATCLSRLRATYDYLDTRLAPQQAYHTDFLSTQVPEEIRTAIREQGTVQFDIEQLYQKVTAEAADIVDLYDRYRKQVALELDPATRFDTTLKPASKTYELWCLTQILAALEDLLGPVSRPPKGPISEYTVAEGITLYYDTTIDGSRYVSDVFGAKSRVRPDFVLKIDGEIRWLADAKFQDLDNLGSAGLYRFLGYLVDFVDPDSDARAAVLGPRGTTTTDSVDRRPVTRIQLAPEPNERGGTGLHEMLSEVVQ